MQIENFRDLERTGSTVLDFTYNAKVDVTTGYLFWKKTTERIVSRVYEGYWFFIDTGKYCPSHDVEDLERGYRARCGINT